MPNQFPDAETLAKYQALLMEVLIHTRAPAWSEKPHSQIAELMDAVHNIPDLLCRWPDMDEEFVLKDLLSYEQKYCRGQPEVTRILRDGPREGWQLRWTMPRPLERFEASAGNGDQT
jgi:hypothetical protein